MNKKNINNIIQFKIDSSWCYIDKKDNKFITSGFIGENSYNNFIELLKGLQGFNINIDDLYFGI
jgi:hypothetical protein